VRVVNIGQYANNQVKTQSNDLPAQPAPFASRPAERQASTMQVLTEARPAGQEGRLMKFKA
jgi:hypothetical protein